MTNEQLLPIIHKVMDKLMTWEVQVMTATKTLPKSIRTRLSAEISGIEEWDWPRCRFIRPV